MRKKRRVLDLGLYANSNLLEMIREDLSSLDESETYKIYNVENRNKDISIKAGTYEIKYNLGEARKYFRIKSINNEDGILQCRISGCEFNYYGEVCLIKPTTMNESELAVFIGGLKPKRISKQKYLEAFLEIIKYIL